MRFDHWLDDHEKAVRRSLRELRTAGPSGRGATLPIDALGWRAARAYARTARPGAVGYGTMVAACLTITMAAPLLAGGRPPAGASPAVETAALPAAPVAPPPIQVAAAVMPDPPALEMPAAPAPQADAGPILIASRLPPPPPLLDREAERLALAEIDDRLTELAAADPAPAEVRPPPRLVGARRELRIPPEVLAASAGKLARLDPPRGYR